MKKMLKAVTGIAVACLLIVGICATVLAAGSQTDGTNVTSDNQTLTATPTTSGMDEPTARALIGHQDGTVAVYNWDMHADVLPCTVTFNPAGATSAQTLYVFHFNGASWDLIAQGPGPSITATFNDLSPVALVVYTPDGAAGGNGGGGSPKTGETDIMLFIALAAIAVGGVTAGLIARNKA